MKKIFALLLTLILVLSLAACGEKEETSSGRNDSSGIRQQEEEQTSKPDDSNTLDKGNGETPADINQWNNADYADYTAGVPEPEFSYTMIGVIMKALTINGEATVDELNEWKQTMLDNGFEEVRDDGTIWAVANDSYHVEMNGITDGIAYIYIHLK